MVPKESQYIRPGYLLGIQSRKRIPAENEDLGSVYQPDKGLRRGMERCSASETHKKDLRQDVPLHRELPLSTNSSSLTAEHTTTVVHRVQTTLNIYCPYQQDKDK